MRFSNIFLTLILLASSFSAGVYVSDNNIFSFHPQQTEEDTMNKNEKLLESVWSILQNKYVDPEVFSEQEPFDYGMIKGLVSGLDDPFSSFMTPEENQEFRDSLQGEFQGIGAELTVKSGAITVVTPLKGSPAKAAGLLPDDIILEVDGEDIVGEPLGDVVMKIRGEKGTDVTLTVFRPSDSESLDITITREVITIPSVSSKMKGEIAYIELNQFGNDTRRIFADQLQKLLKQEPKGVVLDLRFNGGGYLDGAVHIASAFLDMGKEVVKVKTKDQNFSHTSVYKAYTNTDIPLVVLINKGSASAAEIVAGALQDHDRAVIIGETSFGKGTVQEVLPLQGGASLRVTIAEWLTPDGHEINKKGVEPDLIVQKTSEDRKEEKTPQLDKAIEVLNSENWKSFMKMDDIIAEEETTISQ